MNTGSFDFGHAIKQLKAGKKVQRHGWNGKGMFVYYVPGGAYKTQTEVAKKDFGSHVEYEPYLAIKNVRGTVNTWAPSVADCLAEDWELVD